MLIASGLLALVIGAAFAVLLSSVADLRASQHRARLSEEVLVVANRLERLVVETQAGKSGSDTLRHHSAHRHDPAVSGVSVQHDGKLHAASDPSTDHYALGHRGDADVGQPRIGTDNAVGADEARLDSCFLHDARVRHAGRVHHHQHSIFSVNQLFKARCGLNLRHTSVWLPSTYSLCVVSLGISQ